MLVLGALIALDDVAGCRSVGILPRQAWASAVLAEQLQEAFGATGGGRSLSAFSDPQRGIVVRRVTSAFDRLASAGYLLPVGVGERAVWCVSPAHRSSAVHRVQLIGDEPALRRAAQRTLAIVDAWSKTFRAGVPTRSGTSTSSTTRRQPRPA